MVLFVLLFVICFVSAEQEFLNKELFRSWKAFHKKTYESDEEHEKRYKIYLDNVEKAKKISEKEPLAEFGNSPFMDLSYEEFSDMYLTNDLDYDEVLNTEITELETTSSDCYWRPTSYDLRSYISPVKFQGQCGSCWAFATTAAAESAWAKKHYWVYSQSNQQLVDCVTTNDGCDGGNIPNAMNYIISKGMMKESDYPAYVAAERKTCDYDQSKAHFTFDSYESSYYYEKTDHREYLKCGMYKYGAFVTPIYAGETLQTYDSGIIKGIECPIGKGINHGVTLVGYNDYDDYWLVRNSWGVGWGDRGHFKIQIGGLYTNACHITKVFFQIKSD